MTTSQEKTMKLLPLTFGSLALLLSTAACGADSPSNAADPASGLSSGGPDQTTQGPPGASGEVAEVSGRTMQVQSPMTGQVAVTWTAKTTFTQQVAAALADVTVGDCVLVAPASDETPSASADAPTEVTAGSVRITTPDTDGSCGRGMARGPGMDVTGGPDGSMPSGGMSGGPSGAPMRVAAGAVGKVTAVNSNGFTVDSVVPSAPSSPGSTPSSSAAEETSPVAVTVTDATAYTTTATATSAAVKVGVCVDAQGDEDATGAITADRVDVSPPSPESVGADGACGAMGGGPMMSRAGS